MTSAYLVNLAYAALSSGVQVSSVSHPEINGLYAVDSESLAKLQFPMLYIQGQATPAFPNGAPSRVVKDMNGISHTFASPANYLNWGFALANYADQLQQIVDQTSSATSLPSQTVTIP